MDTYHTINQSISMNTCFFFYLGFETEDEYLNNVSIMVIHAVSSWVLRGTEVQLVFDRGRQGGMKFSPCELTPECLNYILCKTELSLSSALILVKAVKSLTISHKKTHSLFKKNEAPVTKSLTK